MVPCGAFHLLSDYFSKKMDMCVVAMSCTYFPTIVCSFCYLQSCRVKNKAIKDVSLICLRYGFMYLFSFIVCLFFFARHKLTYKGCSFDIFLLFPRTIYVPIDCLYRFTEKLG